MNDWNYNSKNLFKYLLKGQKKLEVLRNGVYIPRILDTQIIMNNSTKKPNRLIYIGRLTAWKGLDVFLNIAKFEQLEDYDILLVIPSSPELYLSALETKLSSRITYVVGKSVHQIKFNKGDVHLYPASYGKNAKFTEGVSINVLEMACLGIPSLISERGGETWPELINLGTIKEVNWHNPVQVTEAIKDIDCVKAALNVDKCRELIDISHNVKKLLEN